MVSFAKNSCPASDKRKQLCGVVLAGGQSLRLGQDKAKLTLYPSLPAQTLLERTVKLLQSVVPQTIVAGRPLAGVECINDYIPGSGPAGGIYSVLKHYGKACLVLSCDLPLIDEQTLNTLIAEWQNRPADTLLTAFSLPNGLITYTTGIYEPECLNLLHERLTKRLLKMQLIIPPERIHAIPAKVSNPSPLFNLNTPADLEFVQSTLATKGI